MYDPSWSGTLAARTDCEGGTAPIMTHDGPTRRTRLLLAIALGTMATACSRETETPAPLKVETPADLPKLTSTIVVPVGARIADLETALNRQVPQTLWQIDQHEKACIPAQRVLKGKILGKRIFGEKGLKITPDLGCQIVGKVVRGRISVGGSGSTLLLRMPVSAQISARNVGGFIKGVTATGAAAVRATARISVRRDWNPAATVAIAYDWTNPPGVTLLGRRILLVNKADQRLAKVVTDLQRRLPAEVAKVDLRSKVASAWRQAFTVISLNRENPPVWMRITPQRLGFGGYRVQGGNLIATVAAETVTETFVGKAPDQPVPTPLPPAVPPFAARGLNFNLPVLADYDQLEPVVLRALVKRAAKGITLPRVGAVDAEFGKVTIYATHAGRLAVGVEAKAKLAGKQGTTTTGEIWLTGTPYNDADSRVVHVRNLQITGTTDSSTVNLLLLLFQDRATLAEIQNALAQNFDKDYDKVLTAARKAIAGRREGDMLLSATVQKVVSGKIQVTGQGLFLPVQASGTATIEYRPLRRR
jgi:hypothetical protein